MYRSKDWSCIPVAPVGLTHARSVLNLPQPGPVWQQPDPARHNLIQFCAIWPNPTWSIQTQIRPSLQPSCSSEPDNIWHSAMTYIIWRQSSQWNARHSCLPPCVLCVLSSVAQVHIGRQLQQSKLKMKGGDTFVILTETWWMFLLHRDCSSVQQCLALAGALQGKPSLLCCPPVGGWPAAGAPPRLRADRHTDTLHPTIPQTTLSMENVKNW